jgi:radical SAM superfamily enzyme YgiQ (UPF0313 family)
MSVKAKVCLADVTHTGQGIALDVFPLGMASYTLAELDEQVDVQLVEYPEQLIEAVLTDPPNVIGFPNYMWNLDLGYTLACEIKCRNPDTVIVFVGPNYDSDEAACDRFLHNHPVMDFYVHREGERPFTELVRRLIDQDFDDESVKETDPPSYPVSAQRRVGAGRPDG